MTSHESRPPALRRNAIAIVTGAIGFIAITIATVAAVGSDTSPGSDLPTSTPEDPSILHSTSDSAPSPIANPDTSHTQIATTAVDILEVFADSGETSPMLTLGPWTDYGAVRTLLVVPDDPADDSGDWLQVILPLWPNGQTGWIRASDVTISTTNLAVHIDLSDRRLTLVDTTLEQDADPLINATIVVGSPETPTPLGIFYLTDPLDLRANPTGLYGSYSLGLSGFTGPLPTFGGAPPQIAIHGTNDPARLGEAISNGCIRVSNAVVIQLAELLPLGAPVYIEQ